MRASAVPLRVVVADDEPAIRDELAAMLAAQPGVEVVAVARDGVEAVEAIARDAPDAAFLDIQMPGLTGLEVAEHLVRELEPGARPAVVFVTAYGAHALRAFDLAAVDYVVKPFDEARVRGTVERLRERRAAAPTPAPAADLRVLVQRLGAVLPDARPRHAARFVVQAGGTLRVIPVDAVEWIEAEDNYARLHTSGGAPLLRETLRSLEERLDPERFARVHRSAIVQLARVRELVPQPNGDYRLRLESGARVTMSRSYRDAVLARLR